MTLLTIFNYHLSCITQIKNPETSIIVSGMFYVLLSMTELKIRSHQAEMYGETMDLALMKKIF